MNCNCFVNILLFHLFQIVSMCPVSGSQCPHDLRRAFEAIPIIGLFDCLYRPTWQILHNTFLAKNIRTLGAAVHFATLTAPATV